MKNWILRFKGISLSIKLFIFLFISSLILFIALANNNLNHAEKLYKDQVMNDWVLIIDRTKDFFDVYIDNIKNILLLLSMQEELFTSSEKQLVSKELREYVRLNTHIISSLFVIQEDGDIFSNEQLYYEILGHPYLDELEELAGNNYGGINWSEPYYSPLSHQTIAFVRPVENAHGQYLGTVVLEINLGSLISTLSSLLDSKYQTFLVLSDEGHLIVKPSHSVLLPYVKNAYPTALESDFLDQLISMGSYVENIEGSLGKLIAIKSKKNQLSWQFIGLIDEYHFITQNVNLLKKSYQRTISIWIIILLCGSLLFSRYTSSPIKKLVRKMDRVNNVELISEIKMNREDEIGQLAKSFNAMMKRIRTLTYDLISTEKDKREYEIKMLQNQINPHFLHNTLACINSLAYQQKLEEVQTTIDSLISLLSFVMERSSPFCTLQQEIEGIHKYLQIQNVRYGNKIEYDIRLDDEILNCQIPRLTLQPIVENAIFHGIIPARKVGLISIYGYIKSGTVTLFIRDNGIGMDHDTRINIENNIGSSVSVRGSDGDGGDGGDGGNGSGSSDGIGSTGGTGSSGGNGSGSTGGAGSSGGTGGIGSTDGTYHFNSMGLHNINHRIKLYYGPQYGLKIKSLRHRGTIVRVRFSAHDPQSAPSIQPTMSS